MESPFSTTDYGFDPQFTGYDTKPKPAPKKAKKVKKQKSIIREYAETIIIALLVAVLLRVFVVSAYRVASGSMEDTLLAGDYIFVNQLAYKFSEPKVGDVVVFENPTDPSRDYIKRIVAGPGQKVEVVDKVLYVDNNVAEIPPLTKYIDFKILPSVLSNRDNFGPLELGDNQYFMMGDNRDDSQDSRFWGPVEKRFLKGKALFVYFSYEPDPNSPEWKPPYILEFFEIAFHNLVTFFGRVRLDRIGAGL